MRTLALLVFLLGCSSAPQINYNEARKVLELVKNKKIDIYPGHIRLVTFPSHPGFETPVMRCNSVVMSLYPVTGQLKGYLAESYHSAKKPYSCFFETKIDGDKYVRKAFDVEVKPYKYRSGRLYVDKKKLWLSDEDLKRVIEEKKELGKIYKGALRNEVLFVEKFVKPLNSKITSHYGTKRVYNNHKKSPHLGIDFRAAIGVPIPVANRGKVVYVKDLFFSGKTVIVDHGLGIFTTYSHLSKIMAKVGAIVEKGTIVGLAGKTGRVSGPHLHWGVKIHGHWVSGFSLIEEGI